MGEHESQRGRPKRGRTQRRADAGRAQSDTSRPGGPTDLTAGAEQPVGGTRRNGEPKSDSGEVGVEDSGRALLGLDDRALLARCEVHTYKASGPGGQKRNKTDSAVRLHLTGTGLMVRATESRSQHENRARAVRRMRQAIALELRHTLDREHYRPGDVARSCLTRRSQLQVGQRDARYHLVVGEVLDVIAACDARLSEAAALIGITTANLTTFLRKDPKLLNSVNRMRRKRGMKSIH
ncbi:MAG TPA: peptide chain release factor-like protein [Phycisphaerae bacterium]|nr:peptide chain release factor-like protein [Phycisphaerae bacterium]